MTIGKAACVCRHRGTTNPSKDTFYNADVFGRVFDTTGDNALDRDEASDAGRIANVAEVPRVKTRHVRDHRRRRARTPGLVFKGFKARIYRAGRSRELPLLGIEEEVPDIYSSLECSASVLLRRSMRSASRSVTRCYQIFTAETPPFSSEGVSGGRAPVFHPGYRGLGGITAFARTRHDRRDSNTSHSHLASSL